MLQSKPLAIAWAAAINTLSSHARAPRRSRRGGGSGPRTGPEELVPEHAAALRSRVVIGPTYARATDNKVHNVRVVSWVPSDTSFMYTKLLSSFMIGSTYKVSY